jgi:hypothetical protein
MGFHETIGIVIEETPVGGVPALTLSSSRKVMKMHETRPDSDAHYFTKYKYKYKYRTESPIFRAYLEGLS